MTRREMAKRISDLFLGKYRLDISVGSSELAWVTLVKPVEGRRDVALFRWFGTYSFLFGMSSIFDTVRVYRAAASSPNRHTSGDTPEDRDVDEFVSEFGWLGDLAGCSSVEELELKMAVLGKL